MPTCTTCGADVVEDAAFCHRCGAKVDAAMEETTVPPPHAPARTPSAAERFQQSRPRDDDGDSEQPLWEGTYCPQTMVGAYALAIVATIASIVLSVLVENNAFRWALAIGNVLLWLGIYLRYLYKRINVRYQLTTQRFVHELGVLRRVTDRIEVIDFDDITVEQGPIERMMGIGKIRITSSDRTHPEILLPGIAEVRQVAAQMDDARRDERRRRGLHIEAV